MAANGSWSHLTATLRWRQQKWRLSDVYLKKGHVGAIVAVVAFVIVRVVDEGTVFLRDAISCGDTVNLFVNTANAWTEIYFCFFFPLLQNVCNDLRKSH